MKHCIVNFSTPNFKNGQERLKQSLIEHKYQGDTLFFDDFSQVGSDSHLNVPYQFKVYAIRKAFDLGYDVVLYCDASIYAIEDVQPVINHIIEKGYLMEHCGFSAGQFSTDLCLEKFGITRDEAMEIKLHSAGFTGLNFRNETSLAFFNEWFKRAEEKETFIGDWNNREKQCSQDERCLGHRHDQTVASIIAHNLQMERIDPTFMQYMFDDTLYKQETIFSCRGIV